ncbi:MAG: AAA family ATPase [Deltaproteobacteria bacterium]|nr:AAA family ATPase [Deltaproteobacteria bacterium]
MSSASRMPLVIRGARQTGKTTLIREFGKRFDQFIELNLEKEANKRIFSNVGDIKDVILSIESVTNKKIVPAKTLLFLDEIQNCPTAITMLRYFYEDAPDLYVISAGSLLEVRMKKEGWSFPVGRVEFLYLFPVLFEEFLNVLGEVSILDFLRSFKLGKKIPDAVHDKLIGLLVDYMTVGGMPQAVNEYLVNKSFIPARRVHEILTATFKDDFAKYSSETSAEYLSEVRNRIPFEIGNRIKYSAIGGLHSRSQYISKAFDVLHSAMLIERVFPTTQVKLPLVKKPKSAPKSIFVDIGLCTHLLKLTRDQIKERLIDPRYSGALCEQFVGQELLGMDFNRRNELYFWVREEKGTSSELDYIMQTGNEIYPVEVKSGSHGSLKSLHQFLSRSGGKIGIRLFQGSAQIEEHDVILSPAQNRLHYRLVSLPLYLTFRLASLLGQ